MNYNFMIKDIDKSTKTVVMMTLIGYIVDKIKDFHEKKIANTDANPGWFYHFEYDQPDSIFKRVVCGYHEDQEAFFIIVNPPDNEWEIFKKASINRYIKDLLESGIERKGGG